MRANTALEVGDENGTNEREKDLHEQQQRLKSELTSRFVVLSLNLQSGMPTRF